MGMGPCARGAWHGAAWQRVALPVQICFPTLSRLSLEVLGRMGPAGACDTGSASPWVTFCLGLGSPLSRVFLAPG